MHLRLDRFASPIGVLQLVTDSKGMLRVLDFHDDAERIHHLLQRQYGTFQLENGRAPAPVRAALEGYFDGDIGCLAVVPVATAGTAFQRRVWAALREIPAGATTSYGRLAASLGMPKASRAVGLANGANPVAIVVPCHRVIGANGALTGFGGGLGRKRWLLEHEGCTMPAVDSVQIQLPVAAARSRGRASSALG
jgi:methylated-DNA-[protein]-cysteine S-methyltransferase